LVPARHLHLPLALALVGLLGLAAGACSSGEPAPGQLAANGSDGGIASPARPAAAAPSGSPVAPDVRSAATSPSGAAAAPGTLSPAADTALIEWRRPWLAADLLGRSGPVQPAGPGRPPAAQARPAAAAPWERVSIGPGGIWVGPEDGPRVHYLFARRQRLDDVMQFARAWAPFRQVDASGELIFRGRGATPPSAAERRMLAEWTRLIAVEAADAAAPSPYGLAFAWHRGAASGGVCDDLAVYLSGEVRAGSCGAGSEVSGRLTGERLERTYRWIDGLKAFQSAGEQGVRADALLERLVFAGRGQRQASASDIAAIEALAGTLHRELTAGRPGASPLPPGAAPGGLAAVLAAKPPLPPDRQEADDSSAPTPELPAADAEAPAPSRPHPAFPVPDPNAESEDTHDADTAAPAPAAAASPRPPAAAPPPASASPPPASTTPQPPPPGPPPASGSRKPPRPRPPAPPPESSEPPPPPPPTAPLP
jgi:hypothetical protein